MKFKVGDKVNCILTEDGFSEWKNATITKVDQGGFKYPYTCKCEFYGEEEGIFEEFELELVN